MYVNNVLSWFLLKQWYSGVFDQSEDHSVVARDILNKYKQK